MGPPRMEGVPNAVAGEGAPKLLTSGVPLAVTPNVLMTGVTGGRPKPPGCPTGKGPPALLLLITPGGPGVLRDELTTTGYRALNAGMAKLPGRQSRKLGIWNRTVL